MSHAFSDAAIKNLEKYILANVRVGCELLSRKSNNWSSEKAMSGEKDGGWTLSNVATSLYLGINGDSRDGAPAVMVAESFRCHIKPDDEDPSTYRCAAATPDI